MPATRAPSMRGSLNERPALPQLPRDGAVRDEDVGDVFVRLVAVVEP